MTEIRKGWPWGRALPARVSWYQRALSSERPRDKPGASNGSEHQDNDEVGRAEADHASNSTPAGINPTSAGDGDRR